MDSGFPDEARFELDDVRNLHISYSRLRPGAGTCFVEYVGGRVRAFEVDRFFIVRLIEHLEHWDS